MTTTENRKEIYITDLEFILKQLPIIEALEGKLDPEEFRDKLNHYIHNQGEWGYRYANTMNLKNSKTKKYTMQEAQELLDKIEQSKNATKIEVKEISEVPIGLAKKLANEVGIYRSELQEDIDIIRCDEIRYGVLKGFEIIGFVSGLPWMGKIAVDAIYVKKENRGQGLSNSMFELMYLHAIKNNLSGIVMHDTSWNGQDALRGFHKYLERMGISTKFKIDTDKKCFAELKWEMQYGFTELRW